MKDKIIKMIADEIGVEFGEEFYINGYDFQYKLEKDGLYYSHKDCERWNSLGIDTLLDRMDVVVKKPWIPNVEEQFYKIDLSGKIDKYFMLNMGVNVLCVYTLGGIWRTREEAESHRDEFINRLDRIMKGELVVKFEEVYK